MSYFAEGLMKQNMSEDDYNKNVYGQAPQDEPAAVEAPKTMAEAAAPAQPAAVTPVLTAQQTANIQGERDRYANAGYSEEETSRLLGGPRQKLGA